MLLDSGFQSITDITNAAVTGGAPASQCNMCLKKGLPILPVRYSAVADTRAHHIEGVQILMGGNFGAHVLGVGSNKAKYTLRSLRYGFVYVFYPKTAKWQCYAVTSEGNVYDYPLDTALDRSTEKPFTCKQTGHPELAQCITIENADKAGTVYLAFSNVQWSKAIRDRYAKDADGCRTKRMQAFNASGWFASPGGNVQHAAKATDVDKFVAEYKTGGAPTFVTSPFPFRDKSKEAAALNTAMDSLMPHKGAIFALWDPVGITQELNQENKYAFGMVQAGHDWGGWSADMVKGVKDAVQAGAVRENNAAEQVLEGQMMEAASISVLFDGGKQLNKDINDLRTNTTAQTPKVQEQAWEEYATAVSEKAATDYLQKLQDDFADQQTKVWTPLSKDHVAWLTSPNLAHVFTYDYDVLDPASGVQYAMAFHACIEGSTARKEAFDALSQWLQGKAEDNSNLLLRALCVNLKVNADHIVAAGNFPYTELRETSAKAVEAWFNSVQALEKSAPRLFGDFYKKGAALVYEIGAPVAKLMAKSADTAAAKAAVLLVAARSGHVVIERPTQGTQSQWITYFARQMYELMPADKRPSMRQLKASIREQFTKTTSEGRVIEAPQFLIVDKDGLQTIGGNSTKEQARYVTNPANKLMLTDDAIEKDVMPTFKRMTGGEVAGSGIGMIFCAVNVFFAGKELEKATHFNNAEAQSKFWASIVGMAAGGATFAGRAVEAATKTPLRLPSYLTKDAAEGLLKAGRYLAVPAALVGVGWDVANMVSQWHEGHVGLAIAYGASAGFSVALLFCVTTELFAAAVLPLTLLLIAIGLVIMFLKERELKEFLGRSYFGTNKKADRYTSFEEEQKAYSGLGA